MSKKDQKEMDSQRARFIEGCKTVSEIETKQANELFDLIDKFAGYGFNKSHAAAYALLAYQTAWLKAHYPEEFFAASMCFDMHQSEKLAVFVDDARRAGVTVLPPDINSSEASFSVEQVDDGYAVRYALAGIRNVGEKAMEAIVADRDATVQFTSLQDLFERVPHGSMNRRQLEGLACAGALDAIEPNRAAIFANADMLLAVADAAERERVSGQAALFGGEADSDDTLRLVETEEWSRTEQMAKERENFGFYFSAHPVQQHWSLASANGARTYQNVMEAGAPVGGRAPAVMAAMIEGFSKGRTKRGAEFIRADFSDSSGQFSAACFEESLVSSFQKWGSEGTCLLLNVELDSPNPSEPPRITVRGARPLEEVRGGTRMIMHLDVFNAAALPQLQLELKPGEKGQGEVLLRLILSDEEHAWVRLGRDYALDGEMADRLGTVDGIENVDLQPLRAKANLRLVA